MSANPPAEGSEVVLDRIAKRYGHVTALHEIELAIGRSEFVTLLGPSGCGKTTILRTIGGFIRPSSGRVLLDGSDITRKPPHKRGVNMVFQRPTLFPHLDVFENVAFGLRVGRVPAAEVGPRVSQALEQVHLGGYEKRRAHELSGGQMQRVALARALVNRPRVLLLDEPLSALDLKIRLELESELRRLHRETKPTFVYVTHDQREALALSDRIVVMNDGHIEQVGTPDEIYSRPVTPFTARFVGDANVVSVEVASVDAGTGTLAFPDKVPRVPAHAGVSPGPAWLVLRPEALRLHEHEGAVNGEMAGTVVDAAFRGQGFSYRVSVPGIDEPLKVEVPAGGIGVGVGSSVRVDWAADAGYLLPR